MNERDTMVKLISDKLKKHASETRKIAGLAKEIADRIPSQIDARTIYNTLGPLEAAASSLERAVGRLSE